MSLPALHQFAPTVRCRQRPGRRVRFASQSLIAMLCSVFLILGGCTTTQTVDPQYQAATKTELKPGDAVIVSLRDGRELDLTFVEWTNEQLVGRDRADSLHTISRQDIAQLEVTRISGGKTTMLVVAFAVIALAYMTVDAYAKLWAPPIL